MIPFFHPEFGPEEAEAVARVVRSGYVNEGEVVEEFEAAIAALHGRKYCVAVTSGTAAISLALMAVGVERGDQVAVPALTFVATANAVKLAGAMPQFVDVQRDCLMSALVQWWGNTRAVVPVAVNGRSTDWGTCFRWAREEMRVAIVEDACEALGAKSTADIACYSFSPNKIITTGQGGAAVTDDEALFWRLRELRNQGLRHRGTGGDDSFAAHGFNFRMTNLQAALGLEQLKRLPERQKIIARRHALYREVLGDMMPDTPGLWADIVSDERPAIEVALKAAGIGYRNFWRVVPHQPAHKQAGSWPVAEGISARGMWLPSAFSLTEGQILQTAEVVRRAASDARRAKGMGRETDCAGMPSPSAGDRLPAGFPASFETAAGSMRAPASARQSAGGFA